MSVVSPFNDDFKTSKNFMKVINILNGFHPIRLQSEEINNIKSLLPYSDVVEDQIFNLEHSEFAVDAFLFAPELLSRDEISYLLRTTELRRISLNAKPKNIMKIKFLDDFTTENFTDFFKIGGNFDLETHEALYTADSSAIAGYFKSVQGACNYPDQLIWWVHPRAFYNFEFCDVVAEIITFSAFMQQPSECEELHFTEIINDIVGRIKRNPSDDPQKLIIKWLLNMEWMMLQFYNYYFSEHSSSEGVAYKQRNIFLNSFDSSRTKLIEWINEPENISLLEERDSILRLIEWVPLSHRSASDVYVKLLVGWTKQNIHSEKGFSPIRNSSGDYKFYSSKSPSRISIKEMETAVDESVVICKDLIERHFGAIDKQIWLKRIKIISFQTAIIYRNFPIPKKFIFDLVDHKTVPRQDLKIIYMFLSPRLLP